MTACRSRFAAGCSRRSFPTTPAPAGRPASTPSSRCATAGIGRVAASLLSTLRNPIAWGEPDRKLVNRLARAGGTAYVTLATDVRSACNPTVGSLGLSVTGGEPSWVLGEFEQYFGG